MANSDRLSYFGRRMSLFLQTLVLRSILFREQEHRQERIGVEMTLWPTGPTRGEEANEIEIGNHCLAVTSCVSDCANTGPGEHSPKRHPARAAEKHGRSRGSHACREIQLQTHLRPDNLRPSRCPHDGNE